MICFAADGDELGCFLSFQCRAFVILSCKFESFGLAFNGAMRTLCTADVVVVAHFLRFIRFVQGTLFSCVYSDLQFQLYIRSAIEIHMRYRLLALTFAHVLAYRKQEYFFWPNRVVFCARLPAGETTA